MKDMPAHQETDKAPSSSDPFTILLLEENPVNNLLVQKMLSTAGYRVLPAKNTIEARNLLDTQDTDMVLMDVAMQKHNGFDITQIAREKGDREGKRIPIVAMTDRVIREQREKYLENGLDEYLPKPIFEKELCRVVKKLNGKSNFADISRKSKNS